MIDRAHDLPIAKQAEALHISRGSVYYLPRPVPEADLAIMRRLDRLHLEFPFAVSADVARPAGSPRGARSAVRHVKTLMQRMGIEALYHHPRTTKLPAVHDVVRWRIIDLASGSGRSSGSRVEADAEPRTAGDGLPQALSAPAPSRTGRRRRRAFKKTCPRSGGESRRKASGNAIEIWFQMKPGSDRRTRSPAAGRNAAPVRRPVTSGRLRPIFSARSARRRARARL